MQVSEAILFFSVLFYELFTSQPNLHAAEKLQNLMDKVAECTDELERTKEDFQTISGDFEDVRQRRKQLFEVCRLVFFASFFCV